MKKRSVVILGVLAALLAFSMVLTGCNTLQTVEISGEPARIIYGQGQDFNTAGVSAILTYKKGNTENVSGLQVSGYDKGKPGEQTVTVSYQQKKVGNSATFTVTVVPVEKITVEKPPAKTTYKQGADFEPAGLVVKAEFRGGAVAAETIGTNRLTLSGYSKEGGGTQTVTADYYGKTASFNVKVAPLTKITVASAPDITEYFAGEDINLAGLVVNGTYEGIGDEPIKVTAEHLSSFDKNRGGKQDVVVTYLGKTAKFSVTYIAMSAIKIDTLPGKLEYKNGDEDLDLSGMVIMGTRQGSTTLELMDVSRAKASGFDKFKAGSQTVTITLGGKTATFKVTVSPNLFVGTWHGTTKPDSTGKFETLTFVMTENTWTFTRSGADDGYGRPFEITSSGTYTRDSGRHAILVVEKGKGTVGIEDGSNNVTVLPSGELKFTDDRSPYGPRFNNVTFTK
jgi:predicted small secreted protein